jgi:hypothetical protein
MSGNRTWCDDRIHWLQNSGSQTYRSRIVSRKSRELRDRARIFLQKSASLTANVKTAVCRWNDWYSDTRTYTGQFVGQNSLRALPGDSLRSRRCLRRETARQPLFSHFYRPISRFHSLFADLLSEKSVARPLVARHVSLLINNDNTLVAPNSRAHIQSGVIRYAAIDHPQPIGLHI